MIADTFRQAIAAAGITPPEHVIPDGQLRRFPTNGRPDDDAGWYVLHGDEPPAGAFGDWRAGISDTWSGAASHTMTPEQRAAYRSRVAEIKAAREAEELRRHAAVAEAARETLADAGPARADHPYLARKRVAPHSLRECLHDDGPFAGQRVLLMPIHDLDGAVWNVQHIGERKPADGRDKRFIRGGRKRGLLHAMGDLANAPRIALTEGYATGATVREALGCPVAVCLDAGNLPTVAVAIRERYPSAEIVIAGDNDHRTPGNPGAVKAREAAHAVDGIVALPDFPADDAGSDWNDFAAAFGMERAREALQRATRRDRTPLVMVRADEVTPTALRWLWPGRLALGKTTLVAGQPGLGKSLLTVALAAAVSTGARWPDASGACPRGSAILLSAEDDAEDTIAPRLIAAGANLSRVHILQAVRRGGRQAAFSLQHDLQALAAEVERLGDVRLITIDPISAYLGGVDSHRNAEVREMLAPLATVAQRIGAAVVLVTHLNKGSGDGGAINRVTGSIAFTAAARAAFAVVRDEDDPARRLFLPLKNNLASDATGLAYRVLVANGAPRIEWEPGPVHVRADDALSTSYEREDRGAIEDAKRWLETLLADAPMSAKRVLAEARDAGHSERTVRRAGKALGIEPMKSGMRGGWAWSLPKMAKIREGVQSSDMDTFGESGHLRGTDAEAF